MSYPLTVKSEPITLPSWPWTRRKEGMLGEGSIVVVTIPTSTTTITAIKNTHTTIGINENIPTPHLHQ
jgi:hypothetical protein